jgi:hypothetical protein
MNAENPVADSHSVIRAEPVEEAIEYLIGPIARKLGTACTGDLGPDMPGK